MKPQAIELVKNLSRFRYSLALCSTGNSFSSFWGSFRAQRNGYAVILLQSGASYGVQAVVRSRGWILFFLSAFWPVGRFSLFRLFFSLLLCPLSSSDSQRAERHIKQPQLTAQATLRAFVLPALSLFFPRTMPFGDRA